MTEEGGDQEKPKFVWLYLWMIPKLKLDYSSLYKLDLKGSYKPPVSTVSLMLPDFLGDLSLNPSQSNW